MQHIIILSQATLLNISQIWFCAISFSNAAQLESKNFRLDWRRGSRGH